MKCKHCHRLYQEHGSQELGCPIRDENGKTIGFSLVASFEAEGRDWRQPLANAIAA